VVPAAWYAVEFTNYPKHVARKALAVANPTRDLAVAPAEVASVAFRLEQIDVSTRSLAEDDATEERISEALKDVGIFHFSGHGKNSLLEPLRSSLLVSPDWTQVPLKSPEDLLALSEQVVEWTQQDDESRGAVISGVGFLLETTNSDNGEVERALEYSRRGTFWALYSPTDLLQSAELWMAGDILIQQVFDNCGLAFLSACGSGVGAIQNIEEGSGLPAALLAGGANAVVSAFWPVDDALTALFVDLFYEQLADDSSVCRLPAAVRSASLAIRDMRRDEACQRVGAIRDRAGDAAAEFQLDVFVERLRNGPDLPFVHPFDWAAFYIIGASRFEWLPRGRGDP
jgi:CHAT domain-containing protein